MKMILYRWPYGTLKLNKITPFFDMLRRISMQMNILPVYQILQVILEYCHMNIQGKMSHPFLWQEHRRAKSDYLM